jgi:hypothetical protein
VLANITEFGRTPLFTVEELSKVGVSMGTALTIVLSLSVLFLFVIQLHLISFALVILNFSTHTRSFMSSAISPLCVPRNERCRS